MYYYFIRDITKYAVAACSWSVIGRWSQLSNLFVDNGTNISDRVLCYFIVTWSLAHRHTASPIKSV